MKHFLIAAFAAVLAAPAMAQEQVIQGRLEDGDQQLSMNEYYDVYPFDAEAGSTIRFLIKSPDFLPGGMLIDPDGNQVYQSLGSAIDKAWENEFTLDKSGEWQFVVFQSYWLEGEYTLTVTPLS